MHARAVVASVVTGLMGRVKETPAAALPGGAYYTYYKGEDATWQAARDAVNVVIES